MTVPLLDLDILYARQRAAIDAAIQRVVASQSFILGPEVAALEAEVETFLEAPVHAVGCGSGSDAIVLALRALGIGPGDEVVVPVHSFTSTATSVDLVGARPVFVDVEADTLNIDPTAVAAALTPRTRAVVAVHLFGRCADVPAIRAALVAAGRPDVRIVEDAAQALGARLDGRRACALADIATISFFPSKNLGAFGDGGMVVTPEADTAALLRMLRAHGAKRKYEAEVVGYNSRLDAIQAAVLRVRLPELDAWCAERRANAARYRELFDRADLPEVTLPVDDGPDGRFLHIYNQFNLRVRDRDALAADLAARGIGTAVYYPRTLAQQPCYADRGLRDADYPKATAATTDSLAIAVYPGLVAEQQHTVVEAITAFYRRR